MKINLRYILLLSTSLTHFHISIYSMPGNKKSLTTAEQTFITRCKACKKENLNNKHTCEFCRSKKIEWFCSNCKVWRSFSNIISHICKKTQKRRILKQKFRKDNNKTKRFVSSINTIITYIEGLSETSSEQLPISIQRELNMIAPIHEQNVIKLISTLLNKKNVPIKIKVEVLCQLIPKKKPV